MLSRDASTQIAAERRARALELASHERAARGLRRFRRHAPPASAATRRVPAPAVRLVPAPEVREHEAA